MRTILVGAVDSTRVALQTMLRAGLPPQLLVTLPLEKAGRHSDFVDLRGIAADAEIPVLETANTNGTEVLQRLRQVQADHTFVIGWSQICGPEFLATSRHGAIGFHPSNLPENRGRAVVPWTILQARSDTGATLFWLDDGVDSGDIIAQRVFPVSEDETAATLYAKHLSALEQILLEVLPALAAGERPAFPQDHSLATYCAKRVADDGIIDWTRSADTVDRLIRAAGRPYPGAFTYNARRRLTVWRSRLVGSAPYFGLPGQVQEVYDDGSVLVQCGDGMHVLLDEVELEGGTPVQPSGILRKHTRLGLSIPELVRITAMSG